MNRLYAALSALFSTVTVPAVQAAQVVNGVYKLNAQTAVVDFAIDNFWGVSTTHGCFTALTGDLVLAEPFESSKVEVAIDTRSIDTSNKKRDEHLRQDEFFAAATYPTMTFQSTKVSGRPEAFAIEGTLQLKGVTKPVTLKGSMNQDGGEINASTRLNRKDFGVSYDGMGLADEVAIEIKLKPTAAAAASGLNSGK